MESTTDKRKLTSAQNLAKAREAKLAMLRQQRELRQQAKNLPSGYDNTPQTLAPLTLMDRQRQPMPEEDSSSSSEEEIRYITPSKKSKKVDG